MNTKRPPLRWGKSSADFSQQGRDLRRSGKILGRVRPHGARWYWYSAGHYNTLQGTNPEIPQAFATRAEAEASCLQFVRDLPDTP